jgi:histidine triad (HIT) family protein
MSDDVFCKIIAGEFGGDFVYRDDEVVVFKDIKPHAPVHLLVAPVKHIDGIGDADNAILGKLLQTAHRVAKEQGLEKGYRLIINEGEDGGKVVPHLHVHLLGGKHMGAKLVWDSKESS